MFDRFIGFGLAIFSMILYSLYMVPRKKSSLPQSVYTLWMGIGILISTTILGIASDGLPKVSFANYMIMFISGVVWATGSDAYCRAVRKIGFSRSTPIKNVSAALGTLFGIVCFSEFSLTDSRPLVLVILGSILVVVSASILGRIENIDESTGSDTESTSHIDRYTVIKGVVFAIWAAVAYSIYTVPMKVVYSRHVSPSEFLMYMGHGCFVGMVMLGIFDTWRKGKSISGFLNGSELKSAKSVIAPQITGIMWALGSLCANIAVKHIGVAITWPLTKSTLFSVLYGVLVLKEVDITKNRKNLFIGLILSVAGIVFLALALK